MDFSDGCITLWMCLISLNCVLKNGKNGKLSLHVFYYNFLKIKKKTLTDNIMLSFKEDRVI